jgi:hypothetical protein
MPTTAKQGQLVQKEDYDEHTYHTALAIARKKVLRNKTRHIN